MSERWFIASSFPLGEAMMDGRAFVVGNLHTSYENTTNWCQQTRLKLWKANGKLFFLFGEILEDGSNVSTEKTLCQCWRELLRLNPSGTFTCIIFLHKFLFRLRLRLDDKFLGVKQKNESQSQGATNSSSQRNSRSDAKRNPFIIC